MNIHQLLSLTALALFCHAAAAGTPTAPQASQPIDAPFQNHAIDLESGMLWQVGDNTPIDYRLVPTQLAWRTPRIFGWDFNGGASLSVRNRIALLGTWVESGPENHYLGFMFSPSIELWDSAHTWAVYSGAGGGFGWIDSQDVAGAQGQDFTLNWFAHLGIERVLTPAFSVRAGAMFQHMSNGGATDPNPGIDAVGFTLGGSWRF